MTKKTRFKHKRSLLLRQKDTPLQQKDTLLWQRNTPLLQRNTLQEQRNTLQEQRNTPLRQKDTLLRQGNTPLRQRNTLLWQGNIPLKEMKTPLQQKDKVVKVLANSAFASVAPSPAELAGKTNEYENALVKSDDGSKADTKAKNNRRTELEEMLTLQAQNCAEIAAGNLELYLKTGYEAKDVKGKPVGILEAVTGLLLGYGANDGELKSNWDVLEHADNYTLQFYSDPANPDGSVIKQEVVKKSNAITGGLPGGDIVWARVRGNGGSAGHGPWSDPAEKRVP